MEIWSNSQNVQVPWIYMAPSLAFLCLINVMLIQVGPHRVENYSSRGHFKGRLIIISNYHVATAYVLC